MYNMYIYIYIYMYTYNKLPSSVQFGHGLRHLPVPRRRDRCPRTGPGPKDPPGAGQVSNTRDSLLNIIKHCYMGNLCTYMVSIWTIVKCYLYGTYMGHIIYG